MDIKPDTDSLKHYRDNGVEYPRYVLPCKPGGALQIDTSPRTTEVPIGDLGSPGGAPHHRMHPRPRTRGSVAPTDHEGLNDQQLEEIINLRLCIKTSTPGTKHESSPANFLEYDPTTGNTITTSRSMGRWFLFRALSNKQWLRNSQQSGRTPTPRRWKPVNSVRSLT